MKVYLSICLVLICWLTLPPPAVQAFHPIGTLKRMLSMHKDETPSNKAPVEQKKDLTIQTPQVTIQTPSVVIPNKLKTAPPAKSGLSLPNLSPIEQYLSNGLLFGFLLATLVFVFVTIVKSLVRPK